MTSILLDSSVLLDLVLSYQVRHRRNRSVASSSAAAIESLLLYDSIFVDYSSTFGILESATCQRYLEFYCDDADSAIRQFQGLLEFCQPIRIPEEEEIQLYIATVDLLEKNLAQIADPDDLRAYELYDFLPYHLGEDPTAIECRVNARTASDLGELGDECPRTLRSVLTRFEAALRDRNHPVRAAWALPLLRLLYYQEVQQRHGLHFVPHATKSTIGFGREAQTIRSKRFLNYCIPDAQNSFSTRLRHVFEDAHPSFCVPGVGSAVMARCRNWSQAFDVISKLRAAQPFVQLRTLLSEALDRGTQELTYKPWAEGIDQVAAQLSASLGIQGAFRQVVISLPFFEADKRSPIEQKKSIEAPTLVFIHQTFKDDR